MWVPGCQPHDLQGLDEGRRGASPRREGRALGSGVRRGTGALGPAEGLDRKQVAKPWLRHPLEPYSWLTADEKAARKGGPFAKALEEAALDQQIEALAISTFRAVRNAGIEVDDETLGKMVVAALAHMRGKAETQAPALTAVEGGKP